MHGYKDLGGVVKGRKRSYRIEIEVKEPPRGVVWIDPTYEVSVIDDATNELVKKESVLVPDDSRQILSKFVDITKRSAEDDFM